MPFAMEPLEVFIGRLPLRGAPPRVVDWLGSRGIDVATAERFGLAWSDGRLAIPVRDADGRELFRKYRRDPYASPGAAPKYMYDAGSSARLFNAAAARDSSAPYLAIVEGELDAIALEAAGVRAASTTGGSGTWKDEWTEEIAAALGERPAVIVYDRDAAGAKGALRVAATFPPFAPVKVATYPEAMRGKDATDCLRIGGRAAWDEVVAGAFVPPARVPRGEVADKAGARRLARECAVEANLWLEVQRDLKRAKRDWKITELAIADALEAAEGYRRVAERGNPGSASASTMGERIARAKAVPLAEFVRVGRNGYTRCLWHDDANPSARYYPADNAVFCYAGCGRHDVIDVVQKLHGCGFAEALDIIIGPAN